MYDVRGKMDQETRWLTRYNEDTYGSWFLDEPSGRAERKVHD